MRPKVSALGVLALCNSGTAMFYYPNPQISLLEHILVDNWGAYASNFSSAITPCTNYVTMVGEPSLNSGRTTAAQWMRVAFHDFITGDVVAGTGGIDASIGFETFREENKGSAFNDSFTFWRPFVNEFIPMADLVALGTVMSVNLCGGKYIPYRPGRIDAFQADSTTGVPEPGTDLEETLALFERAGFGQEDSISLTACGHTMGSVHHGGFPDVSPDSAVTPNNTNGGVNFDTSRGAFDTQVVHEYIDGTGQMGGPLVTSFNETSRSDLRLFESDGNKTMQELYNQGQGFQDVCVDVMGRMINTAPSNVALQNPITPFPIKPINVTWDFDSEQQLFLSGKIRVLHDALTTLPSITIKIAQQTVHLEVENDQGLTVFGARKSGNDVLYGRASYYAFSIPGSSLTGLTSMQITADGNAPSVFPLSLSTFIIPSLTSSDGKRVTFTIAVPRSRTESVSADLTINVAAPIPQPYTLGPRLVVGTGTLGTKAGTREGFVLWSGEYDIGQNVTGAISLTLRHKDTIIDTLLLDAGMAGW